MKIKIRKVFIIGIAVMLIIIGCNNKESEKKAEDIQNNKQSAAKSEDINIKEDEMKKYNEHMELKSVPFTEEWRNSFEVVYSRDFTDGKGNFKVPSDKSIGELINSEDSLNIFTEYINEIENVVKMSPKFEVVDREAEKLSTSLKEEKTVMEEIIRYYKDKGHLKDNSEKGKSLFLRYREAVVKREKSYSDYSRALDEMSVKIGEKIAEKSKSEGKTASVSLVNYINEMNKFSNAAFSKDNLKFSEEEIKKLKEIYGRMKELYSQMEGIKEEALTKESIDVEEFNEIKKDSKEVLENAEKMIAAAEKSIQKEVAVYASKFLNAHSQVIDGYNIISLKK